VLQDRESLRGRSDFVTPSLRHLVTAQLRCLRAARDDASERLGAAEVVALHEIYAHELRGF
jgi:hypothetical protein